MKTLKLYTGILIMICLSVLTACSDNITSSLNSTSPENQMLNSDNRKRGDSYSSSFKLKSGEYIFLHSGITSLDYITDYSISNCGLSKKELHITASNMDALHSLPCSSSDYFLYDLLIENRSGEVRTIDVKLTGISSK